VYPLLLLLMVSWRLLQVMRQLLLVPQS